MFKCVNDTYDHSGETYRSVESFIEMVESCHGETPELVERMAKPAGKRPAQAAGWYDRDNRLTLVEISMAETGAMHMAHLLTRLADAERDVEGSVAAGDAGLLLSSQRRVDGLKDAIERLAARGQ